MTSPRNVTVAALALAILGLVVAHYARPNAALAWSLFGVRARSAASGRPADLTFKSLPRVVLWAWERPEDLRFLNTQRVSVAFLAKTVELAKPASQPSAANRLVSFVVRPRLQPLRVAPGTALIAVVRIETSKKESLTPSGMTLESIDALAAEITSLQTLPSVRALQIDFDATTAEHAFYAALLQDVRRKLSPSIPLSITSLASWCVGDPWLAQLPSGTIDEAVPMLFRMGPDAANVAHFLKSHEEFPVPACQTSLGVSTDEALSRQLLTGQLGVISPARREKRIYVFAPRAWTSAAADSVLQEWQQ